MKTKYKILFILILSLFVLFLINLKCFAVSQFIFSDGNSYTVPDIPVVDGYDCYAITLQVSGSNSYYYLYFWNSNYTLKTALNGSGGYSTLYLFDSENNSVQDLLMFQISSNSWSYYKTFSSSSGAGYNLKAVYTTTDILNKSSNTVVYSGISKELEKPYIENTLDVLSTGNFDYLVINSADFVAENWQDFYLLCYDYSSESSDSLSIYPRKEIKIEGGNSSIYYTNNYDGSYIFMIPSAVLGLNFKNGNNYAFKLAIKEQVEFEGSLIDTYSYIYEQNFTVGELSSEDELQNSQDRINSQLEEQNKQLEEQNKTSKNIFKKIGDIFTSIVELPGKLVNLLLDGLKSLFVPEDGFFEDYFNELNNWFSDRLGFLYYPLDLLFDLLNRILNIDFSEPILYIPEIREPVTNQVFIQQQNFNFNTLLEKENFKTMHDIYLILVDAIIYIGLVILLYYKYEEVISK